MTNRKILGLVLAFACVGLWRTPARAQERTDPLIQAVLLADAAVDLHYARDYGAAVVRLRNAGVLLDAAPEGPQRDALREEVRYNLACALAQAGDVEAAVAALEQAVAAGFTDRAHILNDRDLLPLHKTARFQALLKSLTRLAELQAALEAEQAKLAAAGVLAVRSETPLDLDLPKVTGGRLKTRDLRGKVVLLDLWGTWCGPCLLALPKLQELAKKRANRVAVVGLAFERGDTGPEATERVRKVLDAAQVQYANALVGAGLLERLGAEGLPTVVLLDRRGRVRWVGGGMPDEGVLDALIDHLLDEDAGSPGRQP